MARTPPTRATLGGAAIRASARRGASAGGFWPSPSRVTTIGAPPSVALVGGVRAKRQDSNAKRQASIWANRIRRKLLSDDADDTGCGLKAFRRDVFLRLPYFDHIHRYLPALTIREGYENRYLEVDHRQRETGRSKYTNWGRLRASFSDLLGVMWLKSRSRRPGAISEF